MREDWERLGEFVRRARVDLGYRTQEQFAEAAKISPRTLRELEAGRKVAKRTLALVEAALRWGPGSAQSVLRQGQPSVEGQPGGATRDSDDPVSMILDASLEDLFAMCRTVQADPRYGALGAETWLVDALELRRRARQRMGATKSEQV